MGPCWLGPSSRGGAELARRGGGQVLELRMEETSNDFGASMRRLSRFLGVPTLCSSSASALALQLAQHDTRGWSALQLQSDPHVHNDHEVIAPWQNRTEVLRILRKRGSLSAELQSFSRSLGY